MMKVLQETRVGGGGGGAEKVIISSQVELIDGIRRSSEIHANVL